MLALLHRFLLQCFTTACATPRCHFKLNHNYVMQSKKQKELGCPPCPQSQRGIASHPWLASILCLESKRSSKRKHIRKSYISAKGLTLHFLDLLGPSNWWRSVDFIQCQFPWTIFIQLVKHQLKLGLAEAGLPAKLWISICGLSLETWQRHHLSLLLRLKNQCIIANP